MKTSLTKRLLTLLTALLLAQLAGLNDVD